MSSKLKQMSKRLNSKNTNIQSIVTDSAIENIDTTDEAKKNRAERRNLLHKEINNKRNHIDNPLEWNRYVKQLIEHDKRQQALQAIKEKYDKSQKLERATIDEVEVLEQVS